MWRCGRELAFPSTGRLLLLAWLLGWFSLSTTSAPPPPPPPLRNSASAAWLFSAVLVGGVPLGRDGEHAASGVRPRLVLSGEARAATGLGHRWRSGEPGGEGVAWAQEVWVRAVFPSRRHTEHNMISILCG